MENAKPIDIRERIVNTSRILFGEQNSLLSLEYSKLPYITNPKSKAILSCVTVKDNRFIGLYFTGLDLFTFLEFLRYHNYSNYYIEEIEFKFSQVSHLKFDIGIDFSISENKFVIRKTAFFGTL
jgi:hypothetical protein